MSDTKSGGTPSAFEVIGTVDAQGKAQAVSAALPLPVNLATGDIEIGAVELKDATSSNRAVVSAGGALSVDGPLTDAQLAARTVLVDSTTADGFMTADGTKNVTTAATAVQLLSASTPCKWVIVSARPANTGKIVVGRSTVVAAAGSERGIVLAAGQAAGFAVSNVNLVYIDATVSGEGVAFTYGS